MASPARREYSSCDRVLSKIPLTKIHVAAAWLGVVIALVLMIARAMGAISLSEPLLVVTSGAEMDSTLAFWKHIQGRPVFEDPHRVPFVASAYNWLYYAFYGEIGRAALNLLSLDMAWLPTIGRFVSLAWAGTGAILLYVLLRRVAAKSPDMTGLAAPLAGFVFFGPFVGFWAISNNVELAATVCGLAGLLAIVALYDAKPTSAVVLATLFSYLAWSFKQTHVFLAVALVLFLLLRRDWKSLSITLLLHGAGWAAAILLGSEAYVKMLFFKGTDASLEVGRLWTNIVNFGVKSTPLLAASVALLFLPKTPGGLLKLLRRDTSLGFILVCLVVCLVLVVPMSAKQGASENYYFLLAVLLAVSAIVVVERNALSDGWRRRWHALTIAGWVAACVASSSVLAGYSGVISVRPWHDRFIVKRDCLKGMPAPVLPLGSLMLSLPWMTAQEPRFNLFYNYAYDRAAGRWFEEGGVAGLIRKRYFGTIAIGAGGKPSFDGASFDGYTLASPSCGDLDIYVRK